MHLVVSTNGQEEPTLLWERYHQFAGNDPVLLTEEPNEIFYSPTDDTIYVIGDQAFQGLFVEALNATTGETLSVTSIVTEAWTGSRSDIATPYRNPTTQKIDFVFADGALFTLDGQLLWEKTDYETLIEEQTVFSSDGSVMFRSNRAAFYDDEPRSLQAYATADGSLLWQVNASYSEMLLYQDTRILVGLQETNNFDFPTAMYAVDASSGQVLEVWESNGDTTFAMISAAPVLSPDGNTVYVFDDGLGLVAFDPQDITAGPQFTAGLDHDYDRFDNDFSPVLSLDGTVIYGLFDRGLTKFGQPLLRAVSAADGRMLGELPDDILWNNENGPRSIQIGPRTGNIYVVRKDYAYATTPNLDQVLFNLTIDGWSPGGWWPHRFEFNADETIMYVIEKGVGELGSSRDYIRAYAVPGIDADSSVPTIDTFPKASPMPSNMPSTSPTLAPAVSPVDGLATASPSLQPAESDGSPTSSAFVWKESRNGALATALSLLLLLLCT